MSDDRTMRLQKFMSRAGVASRRAAEGLMAQGRVRVNGKRVVSPGAKVDPEHDRVEVDGERVRLEPFRWILLNKPEGYLCTASDPGGRPTVYRLLPEDARSLSYLGRLDRDTRGLLVLTNEGDTLHALMHPSNEVPRRYRAWVQGVADRDVVRRLQAGVELDDGPARAEQVTLEDGSGAGRTQLTLVLREGRKREVRRMLEAVGHSVVELERIAFGPQRLGDLESGSWRPLSNGEIRELRRAAGMPAER